MRRRVFVGQPGAAVMGPRVVVVQSARKRDYMLSYDRKKTQWRASDTAARFSGQNNHRTALIGK